MISPRVIELPLRLEPVSDDTFLDGLSGRAPLSAPPTMLGTPRLGRAMVGTIAAVAFAAIAAPAGAVTLAGPPLIRQPRRLALALTFAMFGSPGLGARAAQAAVGGASLVRMPTREATGSRSR